MRQPGVLAVEFYGRPGSMPTQTDNTKNPPVTTTIPWRVEATGTPLGWACRWGRIELVELLLQRGADPVEADAESWATPKAWAEKMGHGAIVSLLRANGR